MSLTPRFRKPLQNSSKNFARRIDGDFKPHSPMWKTRHNMDQRRSHLFHDRPFIYGRFPKLFLAWGLSMSLWVGYYAYVTKKQAQFASQQNLELMRRIIPFTQAVEDIRFIALQRKNYMTLKAVMDSQDPGLFQKMKHRFNSQDHLSQADTGRIGKFDPDGRIVSTRWNNCGHLRRPQDEAGLFGEQETFSYS